MREKEKVTAFLIVVIETDSGRIQNKEKRSECEHNKPGRTSCFSDDVDRRREASDNHSFFFFLFSPVTMSTSLKGHR
jgi:hypothetical protein